MQCLKLLTQNQNLFQTLRCIYLLKKGMGKGISYTAKSFNKANSKYMKLYDINKPSKFIMYLNANNLSDWEMSQCLPYCRFKWLNQKEIEKFDLNSIEENSYHGQVLEVDLKYTNELYEMHNDYPLARKKLKLCIICCQNIVVILQIIIR